MQSIPLGVAIPSGSTNAHTGDTNESCLGNITVPPNIMGPLGTITLTLHYNVTNNANAKTFICRLATLPNTITGGAGNTVLSTVGIGASIGTVALLLLIRNLGVPNSQASCLVSATSLELATAIDTTQPLFLCCNASLANAGDTVTLRNAFALVLTGP